MKESLRTEFYNPGLISIEKLAEMHAAISDGMAVAPALIYRDLNFQNYLQKSLLRSKDDFIILLIDEGLVAGFCRFRKINNTLFFNNIYIETQAQGKGYGGLLFLESINKVLKTESLNVFQLDVFQSNERAYKWYLKLGLEEVSRTYWYEITSLPAGLYKSSAVIYSKDENQFTGIYIAERRIGTLINNETVVLSDINGLEYLECYNDKRVFLKTSQPLNNDIENAVLVDVSIRLSQPILNMINNLKEDIERKIN